MNLCGVLQYPRQATCVTHVYAYFLTVILKEYNFLQMYR